MNARLLLRGLPVLLSLAVLGMLVEHFQLFSLFGTDWLEREIRGQGWRGEASFIALAALAMTVGLPRQVVAFAAGYAFGLVQGTLIALIATVLSCIAAFYYARLFGRALIAPRLSGRIARVDAFVREHPFSMTLLIRLLPAGHNLSTNLAAGLSSVAAPPFVLGSALGYLPQTVVFALVGSGVGVDPFWHLLLGVLLFILSGALGLYLYRRLRQGRVYDEALELAPDPAPAADGTPERDR